MMYSAYNLTYPFPNLEVVCHSMSSSNCCFLTCIQISQEAGQVACYSHLFKNCPKLSTVKGFCVVNKVEVDVEIDFFFFFFWNSCFCDDSADIGNLISGSSAFSKYSLNI